MTARGMGLVACTSCGLLAPIRASTCVRCHARLQSRFPQSQQRVMAWLAAGLVAYIPANLFPMLRTTQLFRTEDSTIIGGVAELIHHGAYAIAVIVFVASVVIPIAKFMVIAALAAILSRPHRKDPHRLHKLHFAVELIGRWSMIDVFVVAIIVALVQFDVLIAVKPGFAAACFASSVVFTMLSAQALDPRLIWDETGEASR
jgi:paraquat-inducible protein A